MAKYSNKMVVPFIMWGAALLFFTYQFVLRIFPGLLMDHILGKFLIDAKDFGKFAALYYYGYAGMQVPMALLLDRFGSRIVISISAFVCAAAMFIFSYSDSWTLICWSRFLVGSASAAGVLGVSKVLSEWFPRNWYSRMMGLSVAIGICGLIYGGKPVSLLINEYSWNNIAEVLSACSVAIGLFLLIILRAPRNKNDTGEDPSLKAVFSWDRFKFLLKNPVFLLLALVNFLLVGSLEGFGDIWGISYFMLAYNIPKQDAAQIISFLFVGMIFGSPILAVCGRKIGDYVVVILCGLGMASLFTLILFDFAFTQMSLSIICFLIGILCCYQITIFAIGATISTLETLGISIAILNSINMLGGSFFHTIIGVIIDRVAEGASELTDSVVYNTADYRTALSVIPICSVIGAIIMLFTTMIKSRAVKAVRYKESKIQLFDTLDMPKNSNIS